MQTILDYPDLPTEQFQKYESYAIYEKTLDVVTFWYLRNE